MRPLQREVRDIHDRGGLSEELIAEATGVGPSAVRSWLAGRREPRGARVERLLELSAMTERLAGVVRAEAISPWLTRPNPALDDARPIDLIAGGDYRRVAKAISGIEHPGAS